MKRFQSFRFVAGAAVVALGLVSGLGTTSHAADCNYGTAPSVAYHLAYEVSYETRQIPYTVSLTQYDHCGRAVSVERTLYHSVRVPVKKIVLVADLDD